MSVETRSRGCRLPSAAGVLTGLIMKHRNGARYS